MKILITNDDGISSRGIKALWELALEFASEVLVVAPNKGYSGMSHAITMDTPIFVDQLRDQTLDNGKRLTLYSCSGSPVDCVKIALDEIWRDTLPDMVLSGINHGSNSNISVLYSGTMGAATEGALYQIPSIGFSLCTHNTEASLDATIHYAREIIKKALALPPLTPTLCWNVNIPNIPQSQINGVKFTRQTMGLWREDFMHNQDPRGRDYYWMNGRFYSGEPEAQDCDMYWLGQGYITILPVMMDMTNHKFLAEYGTQFEQ